MCFKTAGLAAPAIVAADPSKATEFVTDNLAARVAYRASDTREVFLTVGEEGAEDEMGQYFEAADLRQLAAHLSALADKLEA